MKLVAPAALPIYRDMPEPLMVQVIQSVDIIMRKLQIGPHLPVWDYLDISRNATIKNLTVDGQFVYDAKNTTTKSNLYYIGGVVAFSEGGTIENVVNKVDITLKNDPNGVVKGRTGGVVGNATYRAEKDSDSGSTIITNTVISNCEIKPILLVAVVPVVFATRLLVAPLSRTVLILEISLPRTPWQVELSVMEQAVLLKIVLT